jgi:hypothetical protein
MSIVAIFTYQKDESMNMIAKLLCALVFGVSASSAYAEFCGYVALDNGYRWDRISNRVILGGATASVKGSTQILKDINSYQLGARGQWNFSDCLFIRGEGHYGWVFDGKYNEAGIAGDAKGHTYDGKGAIGYYYCLAEGIWVAPVLGYSYDALILKGTDLTVAINGIVYDLCNIQADQTFSSPFLGFDLLYQTCCFDFTYGYEFHFANWHGDRLLHGRDSGNPPFGFSTGHSNKRRMQRVYGQVFKLDGAYQFSDCWTIGLELKYQFYNGDSGKYRQTETPLPSQFTDKKVEGLWWNSFASTISVRTTF